MSSFNIPAKMLVIAQSGRMLAQMAVDAGFIPVVVDCFADVDTRQLALDTVKTASLRLADIQPAVEAMRKAHGLTHCVYGSGFENCTESLAFLEKGWVVLGNPLEVFRRFQDKPAFFRQLALFSIPYPQTVFTPPTDGGDWLLKPIRGEGGSGITRFDPESGDKPHHCYWQRIIKGEPMSVSFVAANGKVRLLGFNRQWTVATGDRHRFVFAGVGSHAEVSVANQRLLSDWLEKLIEAYSLRGLGSLDFMVMDECCYVLEINARIPASAQMYGKSIFNRHVRACLGVLDESDGEQALPAAYRIIFAQADIVIGADIRWPDWVMDRPGNGAIIGKGEPICSIIAAGKNPRQVSGQLRSRQQLIENILNTGR